MAGFSLIASVRPTTGTTTSSTGQADTSGTSSPRHSSSRRQPSLEPLHFDAASSDNSARLARDHASPVAPSSPSGWLSNRRIGHFFAALAATAGFNSNASQLAAKDASRKRQDVTASNESLASFRADVDPLRSPTAMATEFGSVTPYSLPDRDGASPSKLRPAGEPLISASLFLGATRAPVGLAVRPQGILLASIFSNPQHRMLASRAVAPQQPPPMSPLSTAQSIQLGSPHGSLGHLAPMGGRARHASDNLDAPFLVSAHSVRHAPLKGSSETLGRSSVYSSCNSVRTPLQGGSSHAVSTIGTSDPRLYESACSFTTPTPSLALLRSVSDDHIVSDDWAAKTADLIRTLDDLVHEIRGTLTDMHAALDDEVADQLHFGERLLVFRTNLHSLLEWEVDSTETAVAYLSRRTQGLSASLASSQATSTSMSRDGSLAAGAMQDRSVAGLGRVTDMGPFHPAPALVALTGLP
ncbi:hypothetical protein AMAG_09302 [Allomyces macrogynus ATCC 38327]|uniref:Uncharacterized protein n=1 Tax=Allomyces macrogynus (strain ATCC 38327) TaxID=578462 RepID=A0A0L0SPH0_ALLM3|nr:hypothetical protein AMAG_09302 [Allomyces macrogynus ATCC 38327]|eukprot:KNE64270.1 hypothetical protein AMAG_09302 [Allomyces macrogynus ATCC 38327]